MADREKVMKGLEYHLKELSIGKTCYECPYFGDNPCEIQLIANALELLKEQEPVKPEPYLVGQPGYKFYRCPVCKMAWYYKGNYCLNCGRAVKWDD